MSIKSLAAFDEIIQFFVAGVRDEFTGLAKQFNDLEYALIGCGDGFKEVRKREICNAT